MVTNYVSKHFTACQVLFNFRGLNLMCTLKTIANMEQVDVTVIGGGPTGLFVALLLRQLKVSVRVLGKIFGMAARSLYDLT